MKALLTLLLSATLLHADWQNLWPDAAPGAPRPPAGTESTYEGGRMKMIEVPQYWVHLPDKGKATGAAAVIFPGGGYSILAMEHEGHGFAIRLAALVVVGVALFCGPLPGAGSLPAGPDIAVELEDPVLGRKLVHGYEVKLLPVAR